MIFLGITFLALLASRQVQANVGPLIHQQPVNTTYDSSSNVNNVNLHCVANGDSPLNYWWTRNDVRLDQATDSRLVITNGKLTINDPDRSTDEGTYVCFVNNTVGTVRSLPAQLKFSYVDVFDTSTPIQPVEFTVGQGYCLNCNPPAHYPDISVSWFRASFSAVPIDSRKRVMDDGRLCFAYTLDTDAGEYRCQVYSRIGNTLSTEAKISPILTVTTQTVSNPDVSVRSAFEGLQRVFAKVGEDVTFECFFFGRIDSGGGYAPPSLQWVRSAPAGQPLPSSAIINGFNQELIIRNVRLEDSGTYQCQSNGVIATAVLQVVEPPRWVMKPMQAQRDINTDVTFNVEATSASGDVTYLWYRNAERLEDRERHTFTSGYTTLEITDLAVTDTAMYQCFAENAYGQVYSAAQLEVRAFPPRFTEEMEQNQPAPQFATVTVKCPVDGAPKPTVTWTHNGNPITNSEHYNLTAKPPNLVITQVESSDAGFYTCYATNAYDTNNMTGSLELKDATTIIVTPAENSLVNVGQSVTLKCKADHDPSLELTYVWQRNGEQIRLLNNQKFRLGNDGNLIIRDVQLEDEGEYTCGALTVADGDYETATLRVAGPPGPPTLQTATITERAATLSWTPGSEHNSPITSFVVEGKTNHQDEWEELRAVDGLSSVRLTELDAYSNYSFRVSAVNEFGAGPPSEPIFGDVLTELARPETSPTNVGGGEGNTGDLRITWDAFPRSEWNAPNVSYRIEWNRVGSETTMQGGTSDPTATVYVVNDGTIALYTQYEVRVQAVNNVNGGPFSPKVTIYSYQEAPVTPPTNVQAQGESSSAIRVTWNGVDASSFQGELKGYKIKFWTQGSDENNAETAISQGVGTSATIRDLMESTRYSVLVMAYSGGGDGPVSSTLSATTLRSAPQQKPSNVRATVTGTDITVRWNRITTSSSEEALQGYKIRYRSQGMFEEDAKVMTVEGEETVEAIIRDLSTSTSYLITVQGYSAGGDGAMSETVTITTDKARTGEVSDNGGGGGARTVETLSCTLLISLLFLHVLRHL